ncbi:MAG: ACT domain-containing protein [Thermodesulfovibrionales bacterium]|nr:ACT domain-containing protein [Thermodesulfovibrionales bacterium]
MKIKQISVFLENKKGRLLEATEALAKADINIRALSIADTSEFGILRLIVQDPDKAKEVLEKNDFTVRVSDVIAVQVVDSPGGLASILKILNDNDINVEYIYAFIQKSGQKAVVVLKMEDLEKGIKALNEKGVILLTSQDILQL